MKKIRVMAFGTFDYLHAGHESYLKKARELGDELWVVIARDRTAHNIRGKAPTHSEKERMKTVQALPYVTKAILGNPDDKYKVIRKIRPHIIALGYDQQVFTQQLPKVLIDMQWDAEIVRLEPYHPQIYKSSLIKQRLETEEAQPVSNGLHARSPTETVAEAIATA